MKTQQASLQDFRAGDRAILVVRDGGRGGLVTKLNSKGGSFKAGDEVVALITSVEGDTISFLIPSLPDAGEFECSRAVAAGICELDPGRFSSPLLRKLT